MSSPTLPPSPPHPDLPVENVPIRRPAALLYLIAMVCCVTVADLMIKRGAMDSPAKGFLADIGVGALASGYTLIGICFHLAGLVMWLQALSRLPLTIAYCFTAAQQGTIALGAWLWLREPVPTMRWLGIFILCAGVLFLVPSIARAESPRQEALP